MGTRAVRLREEDVERFDRLSGMAKGAPFAEKVEAVLRKLEERGFDLDDVRAVVREELHRLTGDT